MTTVTLDKTKPHVSIRCPCGGTATAGSAKEDGAGFVVHSVPECMGDPAEWTAKFGTRMGFEEAAGVIRTLSTTPRKIMGLDGHVTWNEVRAAYRVHMTRIPESDVEGRRSINAAYAVLARELGH